MHQNLGHLAAARAENGVHRLHRLDDQKRIAFLNLIAHLHERRLAGFRSDINRADHRRCNGAKLRAFGRRRFRGRRAGHGNGTRSGRGDEGTFRLAHHAQPRAALFDLDLGQAGLGQQLGKLANRRGVDSRLGPAFAAGRNAGADRFHVLHVHTAALSMRVASASTAST